jgi:hypothetical protein
VLPIARLAAVRVEPFVYGFAAVDCHGRVGDRTTVRALGWPPGTRLDIREQGGLILVTAGQRAVFKVTTQGYLGLPATVRRWCGLTSGDRVLLAADPARGLLVVHPPAALDVMIAQYHAAVLGGDPA